VGICRRIIPSAELGLFGPLRPDRNNRFRACLVPQLRPPMAQLNRAQQRGGTRGRLEIQRCRFRRAEQRISRSNNIGARSRLRARQFVVAWVGTANREWRFSSTGTEGATYDPSNNSDGCRGALYRTYKSRRTTRLDSFEKFEMSADNLKAAVKKVDNSAAAVEVALKGLMAA
jgi:hypothetical protein